MEDDLRSEKQNRSLHLWFRQIAEELNDAGFEHKLTVGTVDVPWSMETVKMLFKKIMKAHIGKWHTSEMTREELSDVQDTMVRFLAEQGISVSFPSIDLLLEELDNKLKWNKKNERN